MIGIGGIWSAGGDHAQKARTHLVVSTLVIL